MGKNAKSKNVTVVSSHRRANIAVIIVASITALILIAIATLSLVRVDPLRKVDEPTRYEFYDLNSSTQGGASDSSYQSKIRVALDEMDYSVMSALLRWHWNLSYNLLDSELSASELGGIRATSDKYMVELVYEQIPVVGGELDLKKAHCIKVDGETIYFDRIKVLIGDSAGAVGTITMYPYIFARLDNSSDIEGLASDTYTVRGITVRADTTKAFAALKSLAEELG